MDYDELVAKVIELLQREKRVPYRALKRRFALDDEYIEDLKDELIYAKKLAVDEENRVLVWIGEQATVAPPPPAPSTPEPISSSTTQHEHEPLAYTPRHLAEKILTSRSALEGERKPPNYGKARGNARKPMTCWRQCMDGSQRGLTLRI